MEPLDQANADIERARDMIDRTVTYSPMESKCATASLRASAYSGTCAECVDCSGCPVPISANGAIDGQAPERRLVMDAPA